MVARDPCSTRRLSGRGTRDLQRCRVLRAPLTPCRVRQVRGGPAHRYRAGRRGRSGRWSRSTAFSAAVPTGSPAGLAVRTYLTRDQAAPASVPGAISRRHATPGRGGRERQRRSRAGLAVPDSAAQPDGFHVHPREFIREMQCSVPRTTSARDSLTGGSPRLCRGYLPASPKLAPLRKSGNPCAMTAAGSRHALRVSAAVGLVAHPRVP